MAAVHSKPAIGIARLAALIACVLALVSQLALGAVVLPDVSPADQLAALNAAVVDCAPDPGNDTPAIPHQRDAGAALCPLAAALDAPGAILAASPTLPPPAKATATRAALPPQSRAPPGHPVEARYPRGPPILA